MKSTVVAYVKEKLDAALQHTAWENINYLDVVGKLADRFSVYRRVRPLASLVDPASNDFLRYQSLRAIRGDKETFLVACDSEWKAENIADSKEHRRFILSWQFAYIKNGELTEVVFVVKNLNYRLNLLDALSVLYGLYTDGSIKGSIDVYKHTVYAVTETGPDGEQTERIFEKKQEALAVSRHVRSVLKLPKNLKYNPVCVVFHTALVDITAFNKVKLRFVLKRVISVHHGLVSLNKIKVLTDLQARKYEHHKRQYPIGLQIRDTLTHAPPGQKALEDLGEAIGHPKLDVPEEIKENMDTFLMTDPERYFEYAATDAVVTLLYTSALYGQNALPPVTLTSAAAKVMREVIAKYMKIDLSWYGRFDYIYRGLRRVKKGKVAARGSAVPYIQAMDVEPVSMATQHVQYMASYAYHGGYNGCSTVGYYTGPTYDYDLKNAYPTAMCLVPDIDWEDPILRVQYNVSLRDLGDLFGGASPLVLCYAQIVSFRFPPKTPYPCLPVAVEGIPVYPLQYDRKAACCSDVPGVYVTGPELYLAYHLQAEAEIAELCFLQPRLRDGEGEEISHSLAAGVLSLVEDRTQAKADAAAMGKKSYLCDTILKVMVNSCYGKVAQNVIEKRTWDAYSEEMTSMGASFITNPVSASLITAIVRCVLMAAQNQCVALGYDVYSVTTDGFISSVPEDVLTGLDLYGFTALLQKARLYLTGGQSGKIWEIKHTQNELLNFTTRGNVSPELIGVIARNGAISGVKKQDKGGYQDRFWLLDKVLARTGKITFPMADWVKFKDIVLGRKPDFDVVESAKHLSMDFDIKRKPVESSLTTVRPVINGTEYEIANFVTVPYQDVGEYKAYRSLMVRAITDRKDDPSRALRTVYDWSKFFRSVKRKENRAAAQPGPKKKRIPTGRKKPMTEEKRAEAAADRAIQKKIVRCLYCHKAGVLTIPLLAQSAELFLQVLNSSGICKRAFTKGDLKNYAKRERWPWPVCDAVEGRGEDNLKHFLAEQEPVLGQLLALQADEGRHEG